MYNSSNILETCILLGLGPRIPEFSYPPRLCELTQKAQLLPAADHNVAFSVIYIAIVFPLNENSDFFSLVVVAFLKF